MFFILPSRAQSEKKYIRSGNRAYDKGDYSKAQVDYLKSIQAEDHVYKGIFNLGGALYQQKNFAQASAAFDSISSLPLGDDIMSKTQFNLGNSLLELSRDSVEIGGQALQASIESFKNSLRINPNDTDAKYNLAYAQKLLKEQQQQQQQQNQQNQDQQQDQQDQQQQQDQQDQQQQKDQQDQQQQEDQQEQQQQQQDQRKQEQQQRQISKEDAERMLQALKNEEKKTLEKLNLQKAKMARKVKSEKDW
jgi:hypothetical protein